MQGDPAAHFLDLRAMCYRCSTHQLAGYSPSGHWKLPTLADRKPFSTPQDHDCGRWMLRHKLRRLLPPTGGTPTFDAILFARHEEWNTWQMNMGPNGRFYYRYNTYVYFAGAADFQRRREIPPTDVLCPTTIRATSPKRQQGFFYY